jgi:hypothetical protein
MSHTFVFEAPNFYGLLFNSSTSSLGPYIEGAPGVEVGCPDSFDEFFQYETKEACLEKALSIDPSFSKDTIYGPISLEVVDKSPSPVSGYLNQQVVLFVECTSPDPGVTLTYQWFDPANNPIPTATSSVFTFTPTSTQFSGVYRCLCSASGQHNWTGSLNNYITVKLLEPLTF